jgi:hypothetical protein
MKYAPLLLLLSLLGTLLRGNGVQLPGMKKKAPTDGAGSRKQRKGAGAKDRKRPDRKAKGPKGGAGNKRRKPPSKGPMGGGAARNKRRKPPGGRRGPK